MLDTLKFDPNGSLADAALRARTARTQAHRRLSKHAVGAVRRAARRAWIRTVRGARVLAEARQRRIRRRATIQALARLDDHILNDIGISREQIPEIAAYLARVEGTANLGSLRRLTVSDVGELRCRAANRELRPAA